MSEWKEYTLGEIASEIGDGLHGTPEYSDEGEYYFVNGNNIQNGKITIKNDTKKVGIEEFKQYKKPLSNRTLLLSINGTIGNVGKYNSERCILGKSACYINLKESFDKNFVYYMLRSNDFQIHLKNIATGTTILNVPLKGLRESRIILPSLDEQQRIAGVLSSLDDKIDLLNRENATLEALAETLFRHYFIENPDPTWTEGKLENVVEVLDYRRKPLSKMERDKMKNGNILYPYYGAAEIMDYIDDYLFDGEYILLGEDGTVRTDDGHPILQLATGKFWPNNHAHVLKAKEPFNNCFLWYYFKTSNIDEIVTGAVQPKINQANLMSLPIYEYPTELIKGFQNVANPLWNKIKSNRQQIQNLAALRDILLPRLMSGEVKVPGQ